MFHKVLSCDDEKVICEVALSMQRLVKKYGVKQYDAAWESILDIASALQEYVEVGFRTVVQLIWSLWNKLRSEIKSAESIVHFNSFLLATSCYLTNRFYFCVRLYCNRSQMTSWCVKNKKVGTRRSRVP